MGSKKSVYRYIAEHTESLAFIPPGGQQLTVENGVASWVQQCSSRSRLWKEDREEIQNLEPFRPIYTRMRARLQIVLHLRSVKINILNSFSQNPSVHGLQKVCMLIY